MQNMQKSISDDPHSFSIENIHGIDNLNDLHLSQLNNQLRYELRNLNTDVDVGMHISGDEDDYEDDDENEDDEVEDANHSNISDTNTSPHDLISLKHSSKADDESQNHSIEHTLNGAFNGSESEPFKNYIKSIVDRGHRETSSNHTDIPMHDSNNTENNDDDEDDDDDEEEVSSVSGKIQNELELDHRQVRAMSHGDERNGGITRRKQSFGSHVHDQLKQAPERSRNLKKMKLGNPSVNHSAGNVMIELDTNKSQINKNNNKSNGDENENGAIRIKKCSRCRMKRLQESLGDLEKYQTCMQCRERRKVRDRKPRVLVKLPNLSDDWKTFISKIELNNVIDLHQHNYRAYTDETKFPRYQPEELTIPIIQSIGEQIVEKYIHPLQDVTGFKFAVRDHHNPSLFDHNRAKKITWMFICSQDKFRRRKSRSENKRQVSNRLKTEECCSKITLSYDLVYGIVQISYNHKHHKPLKVVNSADFDGKIGGEMGLTGHAKGPNNIISAYNGEHHHVITSRGDQHRNIDIGRKDDSKDRTKRRGEEDEEGSKKLDADREVVEAAAAAVAAVAAAASRSHENDEAEEYDQHKVFDNEQFGNINMQVGDINMIGVEDDVDVGVGVGVDVDDVDVDVDVDIDVDDVAEIAKLLKQVQQAQSRRLSELKEYDHDADHDHDAEQDHDSDHEAEHAHDANVSNGGEEHQQSVIAGGLGDVKEGASHYLINQSLLEQVREQVRAHGGMGGVEDDEDDLGDEDGDVGDVGEDVEEDAVAAADADGPGRSATPRT